jgi:threonyl-tRNA synthetase
MLVVGDREAAESTVSVRSRAAGDQGSRAVDAFIEDARREVQTKGTDRPAAAA